MLWVKTEVLEESMARGVSCNSFPSAWVGGVKRLLSFHMNLLKDYFSEPKVSNKGELLKGQNLVLRRSCRKESCLYACLRKGQRKGGGVRAKTSKKWKIQWVPVYRLFTRGTNLIAHFADVI